MCVYSSIQNKYFIIYRVFNEKMNSVDSEKEAVGTDYARSRLRKDRTLTESKFFIFKDQRTYVHKETEPEAKTEETGKKHKISGRLNIKLLFDYVLYSF